ncbi:putative WRKY transcription factor 19, partial [Morella rubra]
NLKSIDLSGSEELIEILDFSGAPNLKRLDLEDCTSLSQVHCSVGVLKRLKGLIIRGCVSIESLPDKISWESLELIDLHSCSKLAKFPDDVEHMTVNREERKRKMEKKTLEKDYPGTIAVEGIVLKLPQDKKEPLSIGGFTKMKNLRILKLDNVILAENLWDKLCTAIGHRHPLESIPTEELRIMKWDGYPLKSFPTIFQANKLVELSLWCSHNIKELWKGTQSFGSLKRLDLTWCSSLIKTPDCTETPNLEFLDLTFCFSLSHVHPSIGVLKWLKKLSLRRCESLKSLPQDMTGLKSLQVLNLSECTGLEKFPEIVGMTSLNTLQLNYTLLKELPSFSSFSRFGSLNLDGCSRLEEFPDLSRLQCLVFFFAKDTAITKLPSVNLLPQKFGEINFSGRNDLPTKSGESCFDRLYLRFSYGGEDIHCERNFLEGLCINYDSEHGGDILYFGLSKYLYIGKVVDIIDFKPYMDDPKLKGCSLVFIYEFHGPARDSPIFNPWEAPLLPFACIFEREEDDEQYTWERDSDEETDSDVELEDPRHVDVKDCRVRLVYEDEASQFYSIVASHGLHSKYYQHPSYHHQ